MTPPTDVKVLTGDVCTSFIGTLGGVGGRTDDMAWFKMDSGTSRWLLLKI